MRIAQVAPLYTSVPPKHYGGTERIVSYFTEELVQQGHEVTLFASGDSQTQARLVACSPEALSMHQDWQITLSQYLGMCEQIYSYAEQFDIIHAHIELCQAPFARRCQTPTLTTLHTSLFDGHKLREILYQKYHALPLVSISKAQREPLPTLNWVDTIYHGLPKQLYTLQPDPGSYLAFLGRVAPSKGLPDAVEIAVRAGIPLKVAGNLALLEEHYFTEIKHLFDHPLVEYVGEIGDADKQAFLGNALALVFPIQWHEPFGIVLIEALACGTPVLAYRRGSVPEIVLDGVNGFVVNSRDEAVAAVGQLEKISRVAVRASFEERFTVGQMAQRYLTLYHHLGQQWRVNMPEVQL